MSVLPRTLALYNNYIHGDDVLTTKLAVGSVNSGCSVYLRCMWFQYVLFWPLFHLQLAKTHGNIYTLWFGWTPVIILNGYQAVKDGMTTHPEDVSGRMVSPFFRALAKGKGIILASGHHWKQQRRFGITTLRSLGMGKKGLEYRVQEEASHLVEFFLNLKEQRDHSELDAVLGPSQLICYKDRRELPYTNAVVHEIQRFSNIVFVGMPRVCVRNTTLLGFPIKKGTIIMPNIASVLYDPEQWETPRQFNPGHFLDKEGKFVSREAFLPFSAGKWHRVCLGEHLARTELFIFFASLLRAFTFRLPEGVTKISTEPILGGTLQPHPYRLCAIPR
uniref:Uncharacterized protein n=1 Tax=Strix occidentalis caurina TaxID=311401 RepID=A0A8D0EMX6_STROC